MHICWAQQYAVIVIAIVSTAFVSLALVRAPSCCAAVSVHRKARSLTPKRPNVTELNSAFHFSGQVNRVGLPPCLAGVKVGRVHQILKFYYKVHCVLKTSQTFLTVTLKPIIIFWYSYPKLSKSVNSFSSYSRKCRGCFFETQCTFAVTKKIFRQTISGPIRYALAIAKSYRRRLLQRG